MICPRCGAEYREGFSHCSDCDVDLVAVPGPANASTEPLDIGSTDARLVVLTSFFSEFEAQVALAALQSAGFAAMIHADSEGALNAGLTYTSGVQLLVLEEDAVAAREALVSET